MNIQLLCKRHYTNKDLLRDRFGRLYHLPVQLARCGDSVSVAALDYRSTMQAELAAAGATFFTLPATPARWPKLIPNLYRRTKAFGPDVLIASGDSHIGYIGLKIAQRLGIPFVFDVYDYYPAFAGNRIPGMKAMFRAAVQRADLVLCASRPLLKRLSSRNSNALLIDNGVDRELFAPGNRQEARTKLRLDRKAKIIGYFGSITPSRGPLLIAACETLRQKIPSLRLLLAGPVSNVDIDKTWIDYLGERAQEEVPALIRACDVVTVPYAANSFNSMAGPCKIAEYLACRRPVVATRISGHEEIFYDAPGSLCEPEAHDMAQVLVHQLTDPIVAPFPETLDWEAIGSQLHQSLHA
jgi:glycosyltransferase involved in cell wall biosynthesis